MRSRCGSKIAEKRNPKLWERLKKTIQASPKGGPSGKWSARKSQLLVQAYKKRGGSFKGKKSRCNSLTKWSREDWGYVSGSNPKHHRGRYLPRKVRQSLTVGERRGENRRKGSKRGKWIAYSPRVARKMRRAGVF
jgi:hypothetical protein